MTKLSLTSILSCLVCICAAQYRYHLSKDTSINKTYPFAIIKTENAPDRKAYDYDIDYGWVAKTEIDSSGKYSAKGDKINIYTMMPGVKILTVDETLSQYHIKEKYRDLPIYIDSAIIHDRRSTYFQPNAIVSVKIQTEKGTKSKYINVRTIHYADNPFVSIYIYGTIKKKEPN